MPETVPKLLVPKGEVSTQDDDLDRYHLPSGKNRKKPSQSLLPGHATEPETEKGTENADHRSPETATIHRSDEITGTYEEAQSRSHINIPDDDNLLNLPETRYNLRKPSERAPTEKKSKSGIKRKRKSSQHKEYINCRRKRRRVKDISTQEHQELCRKKAKCARRSVLASHGELEKFSSRRLLADRHAIENLQDAEDHCHAAFFVDEQNLPDLEAALKILKEKRYEIFSLTIVADKLSNDYPIPRKYSLKEKFSYTLHNGKKIVRRETLFLKEGEHCLLANREDYLSRNPTLADIEAFSFGSTLEVISSFIKMNVVIFDFTEFMPGLLLRKTFQRSNDMISHFLRIYAGNDENKDEMNYLNVIREKILSKCTCGGHEIISAENESTVNESEYPNLNKGHDGPPFLLRQAHDDKLEMNVFTHNSILISKNLRNETPSFVNDRVKMCKVSYTECGTRLHGGLFMKRSEYAKIMNHPGQEPLPLVYPGSFLVDHGTKVNYLENEISPFEMRDLYISGLTHRKLYFYWNANSVASMINEDPEVDITFHPAYTDEQFLVRLYEKGAGELKKDKMALICVHIEPAKMSLLHKNGKECKNCESVELFGDYGNEYSHQY